MTCNDCGCVGHNLQRKAHIPCAKKRTIEKLHNLLDESVDEVNAQLIEWRRHIHKHPELPNREKNTAKLIADHLTALGLDEVRTHIAGYGVVGVLHGNQPGSRVIALRADIDALPVKEISDVDFISTFIDEDYPGGPFPVSHACGHDCHAAMLMAAASVLAKHRDQIPGTVLFVFQPAEEGAPLDEEGGALAMEKAGALSSPEPGMVFGMHVGPLPKGVVAYHIGNQYAASVVVKIVITGQQVHGSTPWLGKDPMPVVAEIISASGQLYRQVPAYNPVAISFGHIEDVGRFNIIGEHVTMMGTIRCSVESDMEKICAKLKNMAEHVALSQGCTAEVEFLQPVPALYNSEQWVQAALPTLEDVVGANHLIQIPPTLGYDDISVFIKRHGGLYVTLGVQDTTFNGSNLVAAEAGRGLWYNHSPRFYADDETLSTGVRLHVHIAADYLFGQLNVDNSTF